MLGLRENCLHNFRNYINNLDEIESIYNCYIQKKSDQGLLDYDDLLSKSTFLLNYYESIRINESKRFKWILVDEFQDTNILQYSMVDLLSQVHGNLIMVGDDAQSIYSFRGVEIEKIKNLVLDKETKIFKIEFNYRSSKEIVEFINHIIPKSSIPKKLKSVRNEGKKPIVVETSNRFQQALFLSQRIKELSEYTEYRNIAILYRSHYQSLEVQMELQKNNLPYRILSGLKFNETAHIKDLMAFMRISVNKFDDLAWSRILNLFGGIGKKSADKIIKSLKENEYDLQKTRNDFSKYKKITDALDSVSDFLAHSENPALFLNYICEKFYTNYVEEKYENFKDRLSDIERFIEIAEEYAESEELLNDILISEDAKKSREKRNMITLTTIHQAKGLEWDTVFIISLNPGDFPSYMAIKTGNIDEEERIFYVAATRAKNGLYMIKQKTDFSDFDIEGYDFISKIPENLYEKWEVEIC
jgi:DNA helicase-2/ATP-dependent DNA helicase PcrA